MYKVISGFIDVVEDRNYKAGDDFIVGPKTDENRIRALCGYENNLRHPLIEAVDEVEQPPKRAKKASKGE